MSAPEHVCSWEKKEEFGEAYLECPVCLRINLPQPYLKPAKLRENLKLIAERNSKRLAEKQTKESIEPK